MINRVAQRIWVRPIPEQGILSVGSHARGLFVGSISMIERRRHFETRDHWYWSLHLFDGAGVHLETVVQHDIGRREERIKLRTKCGIELNQQLRELQGIEFRPIQVFRFDRRVDGLIFGIVEEGPDSGSRCAFVYQPNGIVLERSA